MKRSFILGTVATSLFSANRCLKLLLLACCGSPLSDALEIDRLLHGIQELSIGCSRDRDFIGARPLLIMDTCESKGYPPIATPPMYNSTQDLMFTP